MFFGCWSFGLRGFARVAFFGLPIPRGFTAFVQGIFSAQASRYGSGRDLLIAEQELPARQKGLTGAGERLAGSIEQVRREEFRLARAQQALFAYVDMLAKRF